MPRRTSEFSSEAAALILARSSGHCEVLAPGCQHILNTIHHRRPRAMGGTTRPSTGWAANGLAVCHACHTRIEHNRAWAYDYGYLLRQAMFPNEEPVWWRHHWVCNRHGVMVRQWVLLDDAGQIHPQAVDDTVDEESA